MRLSFNINLDLRPDHIKLINELSAGALTVDELEIKRQFSYTTIADLLYEGVMGINEMTKYVWLTAIGKQICKSLNA